VLSKISLPLLSLSGTRPKDNQVPFQGARDRVLFEQLSSQVGNAESSRD
jgi:hypothetical protein